ncbi:MAG: MerR family DNA-binding protein, partial [Chloroflexi bacterium]|nr:MerR family DNA-binding protein [Chloroflexota bacterium]
ESGYRLYAADGLERLCLIMRVKQLGLSLSAVKEIVEYAIDGCCDKTERRLLELVETKLGEIEERIQELEALRGNLIQYQLDLSHRLESSGQQEGRQECVPFLCTGSQEKPDGLGKQV